jgi:pimeloyl-ACP methyl ester carboxylesterase
MIRMLILATTAALALALTSSASAAPPVSKLDWQACEPAGFECATAKVPRDHARPGGRKLELALIRWPASDRENRIGSLFLNPGGPGGSGVDLLRDAPPPARAAFGRVYDLIGFDPRGVGASRPPVQDCGVQYQGDQYMTPETADRNAVVRTARKQLRRCEAASGGVLPYLTTANVARDLDLLRAAVGDKKLNYLGISYGGLLGETYSTLFPGRTGAMVLDSPTDGEVWLDKPFEAINEQLASFERSLDRFLHWCSRREDTCPLDPEDPDDDLDGLVAQLNAAPVPVLSHPAQPPVNGDELMSVVLNALYSRFYREPLAAAIGAARQGDGSALRNFFGAPEEDAPPPTGAFFAYMANEGNYRGGVDRFLREKEHTFGISDRFGWARGYEWVGLTLWPFEPRGVYRGPFRHATGAQPALVIGGTHDPATPYRWAKRVVADLGNARLLTYRSDGHGAITDLNPCIVGSTLAYLEAGVLPEKGASCRQQSPEQAALRSAPVEDRLDWKRTTIPQWR